MLGEPPRIASQSLGVPLLIGMVLERAPPVLPSHVRELNPDGSWQTVSKKRFNSAVLVAPDGEVLGVYDKRDLVAFGEYLPGEKRFPWLRRLLPSAGAFSAGGSSSPLSLHGRGVAALICYEDILAERVRGAVGLGGAELIVDITSDTWFGRSRVPSLHLALARLRAIEHRRFSGSRNEYGRHRDHRSGRPHRDGAPAESPRVGDRNRSLDERVDALRKDREHTGVGRSRGGRRHGDLAPRQDQALEKVGVLGWPVLVRKARPPPDSREKRSPWLYAPNVMIPETSCAPSQSGTARATREGRADMRNTILESRTVSAISVVVWSGCVCAVLGCGTTDGGAAPSSDAATGVTSETGTNESGTTVTGTDATANEGTEGAASESGGQEATSPVSPGDDGGAGLGDDGGLLDSSGASSSSDSGGSPVEGGPNDSAANVSATFFARYEAESPANTLTDPGERASTEGDRPCPGVPGTSSDGVKEGANCASAGFSIYATPRAVPLHATQFEHRLQEHGGRNHLQRGHGSRDRHLRCHVLVSRGSPHGTPGGRRCLRRMRIAVGSITTRDRGAAVVPTSFR